jgi:hypothetical protein
MKAYSQKNQSQLTARHGVPARWTSPRRVRGQGALGCGRPGLTRAHAFDCKEQYITPATEARHPPGTWLGGAPRGGPRSCQHHTRREGAFTITADAANLGWPRHGGASRATRVAARSWKNGDATGVRRHEGTHTGKAKRRYDTRKEKTTVLTVGRQCSRCRPEVDGGAV